MSHPRTTAALPWALAWRLARRELSARFAGLRLLLICLFLGVGALAAIGTLTGAVQQGLADRGRLVLGGDVQISVWQRQPTPAETAALAAHGPVSLGLRLQAMASYGDATAPVEVKAVDASWPLVGQLTLADGRRVGAPPSGTAWLAPGAAARLGAKVGDTITLSGMPIRVGGLIAAEPDRLGEGFVLGQTIITAIAFPQSAGPAKRAATPKLSPPISKPPSPRQALISAPATKPLRARKTLSAGWAISSCWSGWPR